MITAELMVTNQETQSFEYNIKDMKLKIIKVEEYTESTNNYTVEFNTPYEIYVLGKRVERFQIKK